jgi:hypothetical protein
VTLAGAQVWYEYRIGNSKMIVGNSQHFQSMIIAVESFHFGILSFFFVRENPYNCRLPLLLSQVKNSFIIQHVSRVEHVGTLLA